MRAARSWRARTGVGTVGAGVLFALSVLVAQAAPFGAAEPAGSAAGEGDPYVVTFKAGTSSGEQQESREDVTDAGGEVHRTYTRAVRGFAADLPPEAVAELQADPDVRSVTPDRTFRASGGVQPSPPWNLDRIDQRSATDGTFSYDADGAGITVYVIDTGIRADHVEFGGRVASGFTAIDDGVGTGDCDGHGSHVAGTVGSATYGVAKGATLVPVRVLNCEGEGTGSDVLAGLDWVINHQVPGRSVINMSLGGPAASFLDDAVNAAITAGIPVVVAAGNEQMDACNVSPARTPNAITVAAVDQSDVRPTFSNFGPCVDLFAPGVGIIAPYNTSSTALASANGTSSASPHVAGVIAVLLQGAPGASPAALRSTLGSVLTLNVVSNAGTNSPNAMLYAPPKLRLAGVGSATTAPLLMALGADPTALAAGGLPLVDAFGTTGSALIVTQTVTGCSITRPTAQGGARAALVASLLANDGCVQFAQAESLDQSAAKPDLVYVPYARENVTFAVTNTSNLSSNRTMTALQTLFRCEGAGVIKPMLPAVGSGLREFWVAQMYPGGVLPTPTPSCLQDGVDEFGQPIPPNAGGMLNDSEVAPMSVAQWTTQAAGIVPESRGRTRLAQIDSRNPFAAGFGLQRDLYVVIPASALTGLAVNDLRTRTAFVGGGSLLCSAIGGPIGVRYGFRTHPSCGSTALQTP